MVGCISTGTPRPLSCMVMPPSFCRVMEISVQNPARCSSIPLSKSSQLVAHRQQLYEDYAERLIDAEQYASFADKDAAEETELRKRINEVTEYQKKYDRNYCADADWEAAIEKYRNIRHLTKKMVDAFVEKIEIFAAGKVTVHLLYDDMLEELVAYTKEREAEEHGQ